MILAAEQQLLVTSPMVLHPYQGILPLPRRPFVFKRLEAECYRLKIHVLITRMN